MRNFFALLFLFIFAPSLSAASPLPKVTISLDSVSLLDLARVVYGDLLHRSYVFETDFIKSQDNVSLNFVNLSYFQVEKMTADIFLKHGFDVSRSDGVLKIRKSDRDDQDMLVYQPVNRSSRYLSDLLQKVANEQPLGSRGIAATPSASQATQGSAPGTAGAMIDKNSSDQIAYLCSPERCKYLRSLLASIDTPESQVVLRAAIYEVGTTRASGSAIQMAGKLFGGSLSASIGSTLTGNTLTIAGANFDAVLAALDGDSNFKVLSRPMLRVKTGVQAKFTVGSQVPVLGSISHDNLGNAVQAVDYKPSGTIFTVLPDIHVDYIDLSVQQELSSFVQTTTGVNNSPTLLQRSVSSQLAIKPGEIVVFAGLTEDRDDASNTSLFGLSLGRRANKSTSEVLVFVQAERI